MFQSHKNIQKRDTSPVSCCFNTKSPTVSYRSPWLGWHPRYLHAGQGFQCLGCLGAQLSTKLHSMHSNWPQNAIYGWWLQYMVSIWMTFPIYGKIKVMFQSPPTSYQLDKLEKLTPLRIWEECVFSHPSALDCETNEQRIQPRSIH